MQPVLTDGASQSEFEAEIRNDIAKTAPGCAPAFSQHVKPTQVVTETRYFVTCVCS